MNNEQTAIEITRNSITEGTMYNMHILEMHFMGMNLKVHVFEDVETGEFSSPNIDLFGTYEDGILKRVLPEDFEITLFVDNKLSKKTNNHSTFKTVDIRAVKE
jgi:hypothetical protein